MTKIFLKNILAFLAALIAIVILGEVFSRWYFSKTDDTTKEFAIYEADDVIGWKHLPDASAEQEWDGRDIVYKINSRGLRGEEATLEKPSNTKRIAVLGDSFTFGILMKDESVFPALLQKMAMAENKRAEVLNFGIVGHAVDQHYLQFREKVLSFDPDIVVLAYFVGNDTTELRAHEWTLDSHGTLQKIHDVYHVVSENNQLRRKKTSRFPRSYLLTLISERSRILLAKIGVPVRWPNLFFSNFLDKDHRQGDPRIDEYHEKTRFLLSEMKNLALKNDVRFLTMLIPADIQVDLKYLSKYPAAPFSEKEFFEARPQQKLLEYTAELDIPILDLLPSFREITLANDDDRTVKNLYFIKKDPHFDAFGHQKTAEILFQKLKELKWL